MEARPMAYVPEIIPAEERARYAKGNMGKRVGFGARPAVLVVDMTRAFTEDRFPLGCSVAGVPCAAAIRALLDAVRPQSVPVLYTRYDAFAADAEWGRWLDKGTGAEPVPHAGSRGPRDRRRHQPGAGGQRGDEGEAE